MKKVMNFLGRETYFLGRENLISSRENQFSGMENSILGSYLYLIYLIYLINLWSIFNTRGSGEKMCICRGEDDTIWIRPPYPVYGKIDFKSTSFPKKSRGEFIIDSLLRHNLICIVQH